MAATADVFTIDRLRYLVRGEKGVLGINFANYQSQGETILSATARIIRTLYRDVVPDAVTTAQIDGTTTTQINVAYDATDLLPGQAYRLETSATYGADDVRILCTDLSVV